MRKPGIYVYRTDKETQEVEEITLAEAVMMLESYWKNGHIEPMLKAGQELWTPYAWYKLK